MPRVTFFQPPPHSPIPFPTGDMDDDEEDDEETALANEAVTPLLSFPPSLIQAPFNQPSPFITT